MKKILLFLLLQLNPVFTNDKTIESYEKDYKTYIAKTPKSVEGVWKNWIEKFLYFIPKNKTIFEIGSAFGRDAKFIESFGYKVDRSDVTESFINYLNSNGFECKKFNAIKDNFKNYYAIFANAVFLHFTKDELIKVLNKIHFSLENNGILAFSVKCGNGEEWEDKKLSDKRYFNYWKPEEIKFLLKNKFKILSLEQDIDKKWIYVITKKVL